MWWQRETERLYPANLMYSESVFILWEKQNSWQQFNAYFKFIILFLFLSLFFQDSCKDSFTKHKKFLQLQTTNERT